MTVLVFYYIFPAALPLFGYTFIFTLGILGIILYVSHKFPYTEVVPIWSVFATMFLWSLFCTFMNNATDSFIIDYTKSQMGWFFSAYIIIYVFFRVHPKPEFHHLLYYIIAAIALQGIISVAMYLSPEANDFFTSIHKTDELIDSKRNTTEGERLLGYGMAFFGAGITYGVGLILLSYILLTKKWNIMQIFFISLLYCFIFYVGIFSARTTITGAFASIILMAIILFVQKTNSGQLYKFIFFSIALFAIGYTLCYIYFSDFTDWAFEAFINYQEKGEFRTFSSDGLDHMFVLPSNASEWIFGWGIGRFIFSDVGYTRLWMWFGLPGLCLFFYYQIMLIKPAFTRNTTLDLLLITLFIYNFVLNYKGLADINYFLLLFTFYFLYYKYYIYTPYLYKLGKINQSKLRHAIQAAPTSRRF